jgi:hypothetical protein
MASTVSRIYSNFRGADFRGEEINLARSPDCLNVWKDYKETDSIRTRPGMKMYNKTDMPVYGMTFYNDTWIIHAGDKLWRGEEVCREGLQRSPGVSFIYDNVFYFMDKENYLKIDGTGTAEDVVGYIPTTSIARKPSGGGTKHEDVNLLSEYRKKSLWQASALP